MDLVESPEGQGCPRENWADDLHVAICSLLWSSSMAFTNSAHGTPGARTELSHVQFVKVLDDWLVTYAALEHKYSNCL